MEKKTISRREMLLKKTPQFIVGAGALALGVRPDAENKALDVPQGSLHEPCECTPASVLQNLNVVAESGMDAAVFRSMPDMPTYSRENLGFPMDTLSGVELSEARIRVVHSKSTSLIIRKGIFDMQLFKDAKDGVLDEVVLVLVDSANLSWNASKEMPEDVKLVFQAGTYMPGERETLIDTWVKQWENYVKYLEGNSFPSAKVESARRDLDQARKLWLPIPSKAQIEEGKNSGRFVGYHMPTSWLFDEKNLAWEKSIDNNSPRLQRVRNLLASNPKVLNKVYAFTSVSGDFSTAYPRQSVPEPSLLVENPDADPKSLNSYRFFHLGFPGLILRHEIMHYDRKGPHGEYETSTRTKKSIADSWQKFQDSGYIDTSAYPFVFINQNGMTITKNQKNPQIDDRPL